MIDRREEILNQQHDLLVDDRGLPKDGSELFFCYKPAAISAMDEYMRECCLALLEYVAINVTDSSVSVNGIEFKYKGEWIAKEQLFENFL